MICQTLSHGRLPLFLPSQECAQPASGEGVERTFQTYSPLLASIVVKRRGDVRRAKLYYLRDRSGKSARIKEKLVSKDRAAS